MNKGEISKTPPAIVILVFGQACRQSAKGYSHIFSGCLTHYVVLVIYCLISACRGKQFSWIVHSEK